MKWIGQHIWDYYTRFRNDVYLEDLSTTTETNILVTDSDGKISKRTMSGLTPGTVTVDDSSATTSFPIVFHDESNGLLDDTGAFTYSPGYGVMQLTSPTLSNIAVDNSADNSVAGMLYLTNKKGGNAGDDDDNCGKVVFQSRNDAGSPELITYGSVVSQIADATDGQEAGKLSLWVAEYDGTLNTGLLLDGDTNANGEIDVTIGAGAASDTTIAGNLTVTSDLTVSGTTTTINTTNLNVEDKNITLNYNASGDTSGTADGAGITIQDAVDASNDATFLWVAASDIWHLSHPMQITSAVGHGRPGFDIQHAQVDRNALSISASNTTADITNISAGDLTTGNAIFIDANSLTTGSAISIDVDDALTAAATKNLIEIDYDKSGVTAASQLSKTTGLRLTMHDAATNNASGIVNFQGVDVVLDAASNQGTISQTGYRATLTDGDTAMSIGYYSNVEDGGVDFQAVSSASSSDYFTIATGEDGETTFTTVENGAGATAHMNFNADGNIVFTPDTTATNNAGYKFYLNDGYTQHDFDLFIKGESNPFARFYAESGNFSRLTMYEEGGSSIVDYFDINVAEHGATTISTVDNAAHAANLTFNIDGFTKFTSPDTTGGGVEIENASASGAPALLIDNDDVDQIALSIDAENTTANVVNVDAGPLTTGNALFIDANSLTSGSAISIDIDDAADTSGGTITNSLVKIDYDKSATTGDGQERIAYGLDLNMTDAATNHANGTVAFYGANIFLDAASNQGNIIQRGINLQLTDADVGGAGLLDTIGIYSHVENGGLDFKSIDSAQDRNYFTIATSTHGETTLSTVDYDAAIAHLNFIVDGNMVLNPAGTISLDADTTITGDLTVSGGDIYGPTDSSLSLRADTDMFFAIDVDNDSTSSFHWYANGYHGSKQIMSLSDAGELQVGGAGSTNGQITIYDPINDAGGPMLIFDKARTNVAGGDPGSVFDASDNDVLGTIQFKGYDDGTPSEQIYASIQATIADATSGQEAGKLSFYVAEYDGTSTTAGLVLDGDTNADGEIDVTIGAGAASMTTIAGDLDIDGDTITSAGNLTIDTVGDLSLDAHTAKDIFFKEAATERFHFHLDATPTMEVTGSFDIEPSGTLDLKSGINQINKIYDFHATTFENDYSNDVGSGTIIKYDPDSTGTIPGSEIYYLHTDGSWRAAQANNVLTGSKSLLAVGLGADAGTTGLLMEGFIRIASTEILNVPGSGAVDGLPVYVSATTAGHFDFTAPSGSGHWVRIVGYAIDDHSGDVLIHFDPDKTWIEIA